MHSCNCNKKIPTIYRGSTPAIKIQLHDLDFDMSAIESCHVAFKTTDGKSLKIFEHPMINDINKTVTVELTQEDTLRFGYGYINVQLRVKLISQRVIPSKKMAIMVENTLEEAIL